MFWTWVVVAVIAIGLPLAAWRFSRNLKPPAQPSSASTPGWSSRRGRTYLRVMASARVPW